MKSTVKLLVLAALGGVGLVALRSAQANESLSTLENKNSFAASKDKDAGGVEALADKDGGSKIEPLADKDGGSKIEPLADKDGGSKIEFAACGSGASDKDGGSKVQAWAKDPDAAK
jgi:hypothetical protein